jgi:hypothetical protein
MSRITRSTRMIVAIALVLSTAVLFAASPANAMGTGTMVDNGDGSMTVTWAVTGQADAVYLLFYPSGGTCPQSPNPVGTSFSILGGVAIVGVALGPSPTLLSVGSSVRSGGLPPVEMQIPAGSFVACLYGGDGVALPSLSQSLEITFSVVVPTTTTTTTTAPSTTTTAATTPVTPAFTG